MAIPFSFPDWVPWWAQLLLLVAGLLVALALVMMPFSVFGVKSRLEAVEARLDEVQGDIRALAQRLPEAGRGRLVFEEPAAELPPAPRAVPDPPPVARTNGVRPTVPPAAWQAERMRRPIGINAGGVNPGGVNAGGVNAGRAAAAVPSEPAAAVVVSNDRGVDPRDQERLVSGERPPRKEPGLALRLEPRLGPPR